MHSKSSWYRRTDVEQAEPAQPAQQAEQAEQARPYRRQSACGAEASDVSFFPEDVVHSPVCQ